MTAQKFLAAAAMLIAAGSTFAADAPIDAAAAPVAAATAPTAPEVVVPNQTLPTVSIPGNDRISRATVQAEAVEFVKNHKTPFAIQLEQYKN